jgi:hypothetical protein
VASVVHKGSYLAIGMHGLGDETLGAMNNSVLFPARPQPTRSSASRTCEAPVASGSSMSGTSSRVRLQCLSLHRPSHVQIPSAR